MMAIMKLLKAHGWRWAGRSAGKNAASNIFRHPDLGPAHEIWLPWTGGARWTHCRKVENGGLEFLASDQRNDLETYLDQLTPKKEESPRMTTTKRTTR
jgi:hypothetical protein